MQYVHDKKVHDKKWEGVGLGEVRKRPQYPAEQAGADAILIVGFKNSAEIKNKDADKKKVHRLHQREFKNNRKQTY